AARGEPPQGRVPGDVGARVAQPACADPERTERLSARTGRGPRKRRHDLPDLRAPDRFAGAHGGRPAGCLTHHAWAAAIAARTRLAQRHPGRCDRNRATADRRRPALAGAGPAAAAGAPRRRSAPLGPGVRQPAQQRLQVFRSGRCDRRARHGRRRNGGHRNPRHRHRTDRAADALHLRPFAQADTSLERPHSGLGIGLTLSKRLVELHGGQIRASSEGLGTGSTLTVTLPIESAHAISTGESVLAPAQATVGSLRIMLVDDNRDSADMLAMSLQIMGHQVRAVYSPLAVMDACDDFEPELMIIDIGMPELNGLALAERLRARSWRGRQPRLVALTGWGQAEDCKRSLAAGFADHLVKPASLATIERVCQEAWAACEPCREIAARQPE